MEKIIKLHVDTQETYRGYEVIVGLNIYGLYEPMIVLPDLKTFNAIIQKPIPEEESQKWVEENPENDFKHWFFEEVLRLCNSSNISNINIDPNGTVAMKICVGMNTVNPVYIGLPDVDRTIELYGSELESDDIEYLKTSRERMIEEFGVIEYTPQTALNCIKRLIDVIEYHKENPVEEVDDEEEVSKYDIIEKINNFNSGIGGKNNGCIPS